MNYSGAAYHYMDGKLLKTMAETYRQGYQKKISNQYAFRNKKLIPFLKDASSIWFSLENLKQFIWEIETQTWKNGCKALPSLNMGIRIYYAKYPFTGTVTAFGSITNPNPDLAGLPEAFENMHTLFMVPTYDFFDAANQVTRHIDCDPQYNFTKTPGCFPVTIDEIMKDTDKHKYNRNKLTAFFPNNSQNAAMNHGGLCPPVCDTSKFTGDTSFGN
jgi:hypothetical protein